MRIFGYDINIKKNSPEKKGAGQFDGLTDIQRSIFNNQNNGSLGSGTYNKLWVYARCVMMISEDVAALPFQTQDADENMIEEPIFKKFMTDPNKMETGRELIRAIISYYLTSGGGYFWKNPALTIDYYVLNSNHITIKGDQNIIEEITNFKYRNNGKQQIYSPEEIIYLKSFNPDSRIHGQSRLTSAASEVGLLNKMNRYQNSLYDNKATPSGNLTTDDILTDGEFNRLVKRMQEQYTGTSNAGKMMILEKGLEYKSLAFNPTDLGILKSELTNESAIATLMGVPIELLGGLSEKKNVSNFEASKKMYMKNTVLPLGEILATQLNRDFYGKDNNSGISIKIPKNQIDELKPTNEDLATQDWTTPNQKRAMQGMKKEEGKDKEFMDKYYIDGSKSEISNLNDIEDNTEI